MLIQLFLPRSIGIALGAGFLAGCQVEHHRVVAVSGTVIGLSIGQNPQTRLVEGTIGYRRGELALVPTNRVADGAPGGGGASESAEVLMEIQQADLFSSHGSIYQRLAVGPNAVKQAGAAFLKAGSEKKESRRSEEAPAR
jgi:hypothetical protein